MINNKTIYLKLVLLTSFLSLIHPNSNWAASWHQFDQIAKNQIGVKYKFGGNTPEKGFDCSGLVEYVYAKTGKKMPHGTQYLLQMGQKVPKNKIKKGDLIFFKPNGRTVSHVGIYLGNGVMVHAPSSGKQVTVLEVFNHIYWSKKIDSVRRIVPDDYFKTKKKVKNKPTIKVQMN